MRILFFSFITMSVMSCGKGDQAPGSASAQLIGTTWMGTFKPKEGKEFGESRNVKFNLNEDKSFVIGLRDELVSSVKGTFRDMPRNKALILEVEESGYELIGKEGVTYDYTYSMIENELTMSGASGEYLLSRDSDDATEGESNPLGGDWLCMKEGSPAQIYLNVSVQNFRGRKEESGRQTVYFEGVVEGSTEDKNKIAEVLLVVKAGSNDGVRTNKLKLRGKRGDKVDLYQLSATGAEDNTAKMGCRSIQS
jgi:hypothetical protein